MLAVVGVAVEVGILAVGIVLEGELAEWAILESKIYVLII